MARAKTSEVATRSKVAAKGGRYHHGDLRRALVDAALELVTEQGPGGITLREAARRAGVTHAAPYRHFADKEALLAAVAEEGFRRLEERIRAALLGADPRTSLEVLGVAYVRFAAENPSQFRVMFGSQGRDKLRYPALLEADQAVFDLLCKAIGAAQQVGDLAPGEPAKMGMVAWSMLHGVAALVVDGQMERAGVRGEQLYEFARRVARTAYAGLSRWPLAEARQ